MFVLPKTWPSILRFLCSVSLGLSVLFTTASRRAQGQQGRNETVLQVNQVQGTEPVQALFVEDEFIVVLKREIRGGFRATQGVSNRPAVNAATLQQLIDRHGVGRFRRQFAAGRPRPLGSALPDLTGHFKVRIPKGVSLDTALADFANDPSVERVEKIGIHPVFITPNDTFYPDQWHHHAPAGIDSNLAWERNSGNPSSVVAVLDTGVHHNHPDLKGNVWVNPGEIPNNGIDDDHNGYIDDTTGYDFVESATGADLFTCCDADCGTADDDPSDDNGHGTHVAGIVAAVTNNGIGVSGVAGGFGGGTPQSTGNGVRMMPLRVGWNGAYFGLVCGYGLIRMDYAAEALHYVALQKAAGVNVAAVNCSWGSSDSGGFGAAVDEVLASDVMVIHAAGNSSNSTADFLGSKAGVISVAATDQNGAGASFTNFGDYVEISAPGVDILSTWLGPDPNTSYYAAASGSSMAAPQVSAVAGLLESFNPGLTGPQKFSLMASNTKPYVNDGRDLGSGILNANLALGAAGPATPDFLVSASPGSRLVPVGGGASYSVTATALSGFNETIDFSASGLPIGAVASFSPSSVVGSGTTTMTVSTDLSTPGGSFPISITGTSSSLNHSANVTLVVTVPVPAGVGFVKTDTATQGTWKGVYGANGFAIANHATSYPGYAQVSFSNQLSATWAASTSDVRALQKAAPTVTDRIASTWVSDTSFDIDIDLLDGNWHQVGFYCLDWDNRGRVERIDILDAATSSVLDTRTVSSFSDGKYQLWNLRGHTRLRVTRTAGDNAVISGIFFDGPAQADFSLSATPAAQTVASGSTTTYQVAVVPSSGFNGTVSFSTSGLPVGASASFSPATVTGSGTTTLTVSTNLTTPGGSFPISITGTSSSLNHSANVALVVAVSVPAGVGFIKTDAATQGTWKGVYGANGFAIANDATSYPGYAQVSFSNQLSATWVASTSDVRALQKGAPTATDRIASTWVSDTSFDIDIDLSDGNWHRVGIYCLDWDNRGRAERIDILDPATSSVLDTRTVSSFSSGQYLLWNLRGHVRLRVTRIAGDNAAISGIFFDGPAQADFSLSATPASQTVAPGSATTYQVTVVPSSGFNATVSFSTSGLPAGASASFSPATVTGSGTTTLTVSIDVTTSGGSFPISITGTSSSLNHSANVTLAVAVPVPAGVGFIIADAVTQGTWKGVYGTDGFAIANDATSYPGYALVSFSNQLSATWAASTSDVRALQKGAPTATDRIASTWVSDTSFDIDIDLSDGNWHQVGIYCLDWDNRGRAERIDILDPATSSVLDTRTVTSFSSGQYLLWNLRGHVRLRVTRTAGDNAVISGIFFDGPASATPAIAGFSPGSGASGATVTINGTNFTGTTLVRFNTTDQAVFTVVNANQITTTVPTGATSGAIQVVTANGTATSGTSFTVVPPVPTITSFSPGSGASGATVTINGTNFTGATLVRFNTTDQAVLTVVNANQITTTVPTGATSGAIQVVTPGGTATSGTNFTVVPAAPTGLTATAGNGQVSLSWTSVSGASSYNVKRSIVSGGPHTTIASPTTTSYLNTLLTNGATYYYVVSAVNASGESAISAQVSATPVAPNQAPAVNAGPDQTISLPNTATLNGSVIDDGLPSNTLTITWSTVSGPGTVTFSNANAAVTTASFSAAGSYVLRLTGDDGALSNSDDAIIAVTDLIFANGFELGNLAAWSPNTTDGGNLSVSAGAGLVGSFGMQALINDNNPIYVVDESPIAESRYRARFYFHPNSIPMSNGNAHYILQGLNSSGTVVLRVEFRLSGGQYQLRASLLNDGTGFSNTSWFTIANATHPVELDWRASTAPGANNGGVTFWTDGVQRANLSTVDNDTRRIERVRLGAVSGIDSGTRGTYYFDAFESRRTTYIGPVVP